MRGTEGLQMSEATAPKTVKEFEDRLIEVADTLPKRLRQCADFVAANHERIAVSTVAEMADGAGVQPSAFMRFCQIMGFSGFSEMQKMFRESFVGGWPDYSTRLDHLREKGDESGITLLAEFVDAGRTSLENILKTVDPQELENGIDCLSRANIIHIIGLRRSFSVASYLAYAFEKMGVPAVLHNSAGQLNSLSALQKGDAVIAVTFAPYSSETIELTEHALERGIPVVALTDTSVSPLRKIGTHLICVNEVDFGAFRSLSATLCVAISLAVSVGTRRIK
jgi:DNA-binding MurR/RpiR family transcriptional regulator